MDLEVSQLSSIMFSSERGQSLQKAIETAFTSLIKNDVNLFNGEQFAPNIWERRWINDSSVWGYNVGDAVWISLVRPEEVLEERKAQISSYIAGNSKLYAAYQAVKDDEGATRRFLLSCITSSVNGQPSLYYLGNIGQKVQIKVCIKSESDGGCKTRPDDASHWIDFYQTSTIASNGQLLSDVLSSTVSSAIAQHLEEYHQTSALTDEKMYGYGFFKRTDLSDSTIVTPQRFYDHSYCEEMKGLDYVEKFQLDTSDANDTKWCRQWKSGYLEQGGMVANTGSRRLIDVKFLSSYNYPVGQSFYQSKHATYSGTSLTCTIPYAKRYTFTITPIARSGQTSPYPAMDSSVQNVAIYATADGTSFKNDGFQIVNTDLTSSTKSQTNFSKYSWYVAGYTVPNN